MEVGDLYYMLARGGYKAFSPYNIILLVLFMTFFAVMLENGAGINFLCPLYMRAAFFRLFLYVFYLRCLFGPTLSRYFIPGIKSSMKRTSVTLISIRILRNRDSESANTSGKG